jgi:dTDP-4-dehydrorhamnose 3,5-epimerase
MIEGVIIKKLNKYEAERGHLMEIFRLDENIIKPVMSYISLTKPQVVRGPHEHVYQSDFFIFPGPGDFYLYLWDRRENSKSKGEHIKIELGQKNPCSVLVPPGVVHGYKCISKIPAFSINLPDKLYKGENKQEEVDEIRWEEKSDNPYIID